MFYVKNSLLNIMKKNIWIWALAATTLMTACSQDNEPMPEPTPPITDNDWIGPDGQVVIQLGGVDNASANAVVTRAPIESDDDFFYNLANTPTPVTPNTVGIFALASNVNDWSDTGNYGILLNNIEGIGDSSRKKGTADGAEKDNLNKITLKATTGSTWGGVYYYPMKNTYNYNFYGYAPYVTGESVSATDSKISFNNFNGSQDIMYSEATAASRNVSDLLGYTPKEGETVLNGYNAKYIRVLKYHKEKIDAGETGTAYPWIPNLVFNHQLVWLKFSIVVAQNQSSGDKTLVTSQLKVKDITLKNHPNSVDLDLLPQTENERLVWGNTLDNLKMLTPKTNTVETGSFAPENDTWNESTKPAVRGYLLVKPEKSYTVSLTVVPETKDSGVQPESQTFDVVLKNGATGFEKGKSYNIRLGIYALQEVEATAELTPWGEDEVVDIPVE